MTGRGQREGVAAEFLRDVLAGRALGVPKLEAMARTAGLLGEGQRITHAKVFKKAKKSLGIRSVRNGFGDAGEWLWQLESANGSRRVFERRRVDAGNVTLPWIEWGRRPGDV
jgi:hypothetical protein